MKPTQPWSLVTVVVSLALAAAPAHALPSIRVATIPAHDGVPLAATVFEPDRPGPHAAIVLTASWGQQNLQYLVPALQLASRGYVVVSYTARGFFDSGGEVTVAGPDDVQDLSSVIDWTIASTDTDPTRVGAAGMSYAAGIALLGAAFDPRIRAVVSLSGWSDLVTSIYGNHTRSRQSLSFLLLLASYSGRPSAEMAQVLTDFRANRNLDGLIEYGRIRGAASYLDRINQHRPAILLSSAWSETIFPTAQLIGFFDALAGPRRWELRPGDHVSAEVPGLLGLPNEAWASLGRWFDHHLRGIDNGIDREPAILAEPRTPGPVERYASWSDMATARMRLELDGAHTIAAGVDTVASAGTCIVSGNLESLVGIAPLAWLPAVHRAHAAVWTGAPLARAAQVRGTARLRIAVASSTDEPTTLFAYLYDLDGAGVGRLVAHLPYTLLAPVPGRAEIVDAAFTVTAYDVPAGHRLALVVDTVDPLYHDAAPPGSTLTVSDASVELPLR